MSRRRTQRHHHGKSGKTNHPASWLNPHKRVASSITRDVADVELWDDEIEERGRLEKEREKDEPEEDWDGPEAQTEPGNGLT